LLAALAAGKPPTAPAGTAATRRSRGLALGVGEISHRTSIIRVAGIILGSADRSGSGAATWDCSRSPRQYYQCPFTLV